MQEPQRDGTSPGSGRSAFGLSRLFAAMRQLSPRLRRGLLGRVPLLVLFAGLGVHIAVPDLLDRVTLMCFDLYQRVLPRQPGGDPIRIIDIDNKSIREIGQWPWPRSTIAQLVDRLGQAGAAAVVFDIFFSEPDRTSPKFLTASLRRENLDPGTMREATRVLAELPDPDGILAAAMHRAPTVTAYVLNNRDKGEVSEPPATKAGFGFASGGKESLAHVPNFNNAIGTLPQLSAAALGNGFVNPSVDRDGIARQVPFVLKFDDDPVPSLAAEGLRVAQGAHGYVTRRAANGELQIRDGDLIVPTDAAGRVWLHFRNTNPDIYDSCAKILADNFDPKSPAVQRRFAGRIVLVGTSAKGLVADYAPTPIDRRMLGMELQAQAMEQAIEGGFLTRPQWGDGAGTLYALVLGILLALLLPRFGALVGAGLALTGIGAAIAASWLAFSHSDLLIDPVYPVAMLLLVYVVATLLGYLRTEARHREIRSTFSRYMSPKYVEVLVHHPERLTDLGGELRTMTIMFCDIRGFTSISEGIDAHALTQLTNSFLSPMTDIITQHQGTIDKYIGDCIMAFWNAPLDDPEHAGNALRAAQEMRRKLVDLNRGWQAEAQAEGRPHRPIKIGIGVNSGDCVVGNFGSTQRMEISLRGDAVNLASRLEGLGKVYGVDLVIGEETARLCGEAELVELDLVAVKGRSQAVHVYTIEPEPVEEPAFGDSHAALLTAYRGRDWAGALALLDGGVLAAARHLEPVYDLYRRRIAEFQIRTPPADWNGVFAAEEK